jgi:hypothetical protein
MYVRKDDLPPTKEGSGMVEASRQAGAGTTRAASRSWRRWPGWVGYAAGFWSLVYGLLGLWWTLGGSGFPFGSENDPGVALSVLGAARAQTTARVIVALGLIGAVAAVAMARVRGRGILCATLLGVAWTIALVLALLIPDYRVLMAVAYTPIVLIGEPFGWPPGVSLLDAFPWPVVNQFVCVGGGLLWAATALAYGRRSAGACGFCGRKDASSGFRESAAFSSVVKLVLEYAAEMTRTPAVIPDHLFGTLREHFDEAQLVELTAAIAWENHRARFNHALGMGYGGFSEGSYCPLAGDSEEGSIPRMEVHE